MWLKCYVGLLAVSCVHFTKAVEFIPDQTLFSVSEGSYLEVKCTSRDGFHIQWSANVSDVALHTSLTFLTANGDTAKRLLFYNVTQADAMTYTCQGRQATDQASFELKVFTVTRRHAVFEDNHKATLSCHVEDPGTYTYMWKKGETFLSDMPVERKQGFVSDSNGTLEIRHPDRSAAGQFTCIAIYRRQNETAVGRPPTYPAGFTWDGDVVFNCSQLKSGQLHIYNWTKDNIPIFDIPLKENQAFIVYSNGTLEIKNADSDLRGHYFCLATYVQPYAIETKVNYYAEPEVDFIDKSKMGNGNQVLVCNVLGYPEPNITWWKGDNHIKGGGIYADKLSAAVYNGMIVNDAKLEIRGVLSEKGEDYMCMAQNLMWPGFNSTSTIHVRAAVSHVGLHTRPLTTFIGLCVVLSMMFM